MAPRAVMMIGGGIQQVEAVSSLKSLGFHVIVTDRRPDAPAMLVADTAVTIDGRDIEKLIAFTLLNKKALNICGVFTLTEMVTSVAAIAQAAKLPGVSLRSSVCCQHKWLCKQQWQTDHIPTPDGVLVNSLKDGLRGFEQFNHQVFIKPLVGFGGVGAKAIGSKTELIALLTQFLHKHQPVLMEPIMVGTMHDVNAIFNQKGDFIPLGCFDRNFLSGHPVDIGAIYPSRLDKDQQDEMFTITENAARSLGIHWGPVKADLVLRHNQAAVLEMAPRLHGPKGTLYLTQYAQKINHLQQALPIIMGDTRTIENQIVPIRQAGYSAILPPLNCDFDLTRLPRLIKNMNHDLVLILKEFGRVEHYRDSTDVPGYVFTSGESYFDLNEKLKKINNWLGGYWENN